MNHHFISAALFLRELRAREIQPRPLARRPAGDSSRSASRTQSVKAFWKSGINGFPPPGPPIYSVFHFALLRPLTATGFRGAPRFTVSLLEKNCMSNSFPKQNLPLRVVLNRVGEATLNQYGAARRPMDSPEAAYLLWREVVAEDPCHEPEKEHLVTALLNAKLRLIGYHIVSVGSLNEAIAHPREIYRATILAGAYAHVLMHNHPSGDPTPSDADRRLTRKIQEAGQIVEISLLDHVIVGAPEAGCAPYFSFRGGGALMNDPHDSILRKVFLGLRGPGRCPGGHAAFHRNSRRRAAPGGHRAGIRPSAARGGIRHRDCPEGGRAMNRDIYEAITARFIEQLKRGTVPWQKPWFGVQNIVSRKPYRGINALLLGSTDYQSPFWISFKQALDLGGHVKKGEKSTPVIYYKILEKRDEAGKIDAARGRQARSHSVRPVGECFQSRPDRRHPGTDDHGEPGHVAAARKGGCHRGKCPALSHPPRGIRRVLLAHG